MRLYNDTKKLLCRHAGIDQHTLGDVERRKVQDWVTKILNAGTNCHPERDQRPDILAEKLVSARTEIRAIIARIESLDAWALSRVRSAPLTAQIRAVDDDDLIENLMEKWRAVPQDQWPDKVAIQSLRELESGLEYPIDALIEKGSALPAGKGKKPNLVARKVALAAACALHDLTGERPTYWQDATAFAKLTADLFRLFNVRADTRRPCESALSELARTR